MLALQAADVHLQSVVLAACNCLWGMLVRGGACYVRMLSPIWLFSLNGVDVSSHLQAKTT